MTYSYINYKYFLFLICFYSLLAICGDNPDSSKNQLEKAIVNYHDKVKSDMNTESLISSDGLHEHLKSKGIFLEKSTDKEDDQIPSTSKVVCTTDTSNDTDSYTLGIIDVSSSMNQTIYDGNEKTSKLAACLATFLSFMSKAIDNRHDAFLTAFNKRQFSLCDSSTAKELIDAYKLDKTVVEDYVHSVLEPITQKSQSGNSNFMTQLESLESFCDDMSKPYTNQNIVAFTDGEVTDPKGVKMSDEFIEMINSEKINFDIYIANSRGHYIKSKLSSKERCIPDKCLHVMNGLNDDQRMQSFTAEINSRTIQPAKTRTKEQHDSYFHSNPDQAFNSMSSRPY